MKSPLTSFSSLRKLFTTSLLGLFVLLANSELRAQVRYLDPSFSVGVTYDVKYGKTFGLIEESHGLSMDIYEPLNDLEAKRPVVIMAHGGGFIMGTKNNHPMETICSRLAQLGYVCASIEYSLGFEKGDPNLSAWKTVLMAIQDMKTSIRYLRSTVDSGNPYKIDPEQIWVGGSSAGAITALHAAYIDSGDIQEMKWDISDFGGLEGTGGYHEYSSSIQGVISLSGAIGDTNAIEESIPLVSVHGSADEIVPFGAGKIKFNFPFFGHVPAADVMGDSIMKIRMDKHHNSGNTKFLVMEGQGHCPYDKVLNWKHYESYMDTTLNVVRCFLYNELWNDGPDVYDYTMPHVSAIGFDRNGNTWKFFAVDKSIMRIKVRVETQSGKKIKQKTLRKKLKAFTLELEEPDEPYSITVKFNDYSKRWTFPQ